MNTRWLIYLICCTLALGCGRVQKPNKPLNEAHQGFLKKIHEEYKLPDVRLTALEKTIWIFIPFEGPLFEYQASRKSEDAGKKEQSWTVNSLETVYANRAFDIKYDISLQNKYPKDPGYGSNYTEKFNLIYQKVTTALRENYMDVATPPEFIVIVIADITRGIKITYTTYFEDLKYYSAGQLPHEEFLKRMVNDLAGDTYLVEDKEGKSIETTEVSMADFLAKQITTRVNFKYGRSDFPPSENVQNEILYQVNQTLDAYDFTDFDHIILHDLVTNQDVTVPKADLANHQDLPLPAGGTLHTIKFFE